MKKSTRFEEKLKVYASIAVGVASVGLAQGQTYTDLNPDVVVTTVGDSLGIDFDADGTFDYSIRRMDWSGVATNTAVVGAPLVVLNGGMGTMGSVIPYLSALALNDPIGSAGPWQVNDGADPQQRKQGLASTYSGGFYGNFGDNAEHYIGVQFQIGAAFHYGWIRVSAIPQDGSTVTIMDYAYNPIADATINAGQVISSIDDIALDGNVFAFDKQINIRMNQSVTGSITVYNSVGQVVLSQELNGVTEEIDMNFVESGIYTVVIESADQRLVKKVSL